MTDGVIAVEYMYPWILGKTMEENPRLMEMNAVNKKCKFMLQ